MEDSPMPTVMLFCDPTGRIVEGHPGNGLDRDLPTGGNLWEALNIDADSVNAVMAAPPETIHTVVAPPGQTALLQVLPIPPSMAPNGGFLAALTLPPAPLGETNHHNPEASASALDYAVFNAVFNDVDAGILLTDDNFSILSANRKARDMYTMGNDGLEGKPLPDILRPSDQTRVLTTAGSLASGGFWRGNLTTLGSGGQKITVSVTIRSLNVREVRLFQFILTDLRKRISLERDLAQSRLQVQDMDTALKQVLRNVEEERQELKDELVQQVREGVLPTIERIVQEDSHLVRQAYRSALEEKIADMVETSSEAESLFALLTPREMDICRLIQQSWQGRAIAEQLGISFETLQTHRKNIRRKLGLKGGPISLSAFLQQHPPL
jgi:PAS domain S-box-containing protein